MICQRCRGDVIGPVWDRRHASWWRQNVTCRHLTLPASPMPRRPPSGPSGVSQPSPLVAALTVNIPGGPRQYRTLDDALADEEVEVQVRNPDGTWRPATGLQPGTLYHVRIQSRRG